MLIPVAGATLGHFSLQEFTRECAFAEEGLCQVGSPLRDLPQGDEQGTWGGGGGGTGVGGGRFTGSKREDVQVCHTL